MLTKIQNFDKEDELALKIAHAIIKTKVDNFKILENVKDKYWDRLRLLFGKKDLAIQSIRS